MVQQQELMHLRAAIDEAKASNFEGKGYREDALEETDEDDDGEALMQAKLPRPCN